MTPQDREQFRALSLRQAQLEAALAQLKAEFNELEQRAETSPISIPTLPPLPVPTPEPVQAAPPPLPVVATVKEEVAAAEFRDPHTLPGYPASLSSPELAWPQDEREPQPAPASHAKTSNSEPEKSAVVNQGGLEFQFGRWLARIGVVFALITLISFSTLAYKQFYYLLGPWSKLTFLSLISVGLVAAGLRIERKNSKLTVYGRTLAGGGLACLYYTLYGASYVSQLRVIGSPLLGGILLLGWSAYVLYLAQKKQSEILSIFAIALAYFSSAITPVGGFTMAANLILSATAVIFLVRNAWTGLSYLCLVGTYAGLLRQFVVSDDWLELAHDISFWPAVVYLAGAWVIYTAGVFLAKTPSFAAGKRMAFLCLNNGAFIGLLTTSSYVSEYGHVGPILCLVGGVFLATSWLARMMRSESSEIAGAYLMQGLALATGGVAIAYSGVTRGLLITTESVFLAAAGAYSRNAIFRVAGYLSGLLGSVFLLGEIVFTTHFSWVLPLGGVLAMLTNACLARREFWREPREVSAQRFVLSSAYYILLALGLLTAGIICASSNEAWVAIDLAAAALVLTFVVYAVPLFELPLLSQLLLILAQLIALFPLGDTLDVFPVNPYGTSNWDLYFFISAHGLKSQCVVAFVTMLLVTWWPRQKLVRTGFWLQPLTMFYALAMSAFCFNAIYPRETAQEWMITATLLSLAFLAYGAWSRLWQFMVSGQIYLVLAICTFLNPSAGLGEFPWSWWAAAFPPAVVFLTGWLAHRWLPRLLAASETVRSYLSATAYCYQVIALALAVRWIFGIVPEAGITLALFVFATVFLSINLRWPSAFGVRAGLVVSLVGTGYFLSRQGLADTYGFTWPVAAASALFLVQPAMLRRWGRELISSAESWAVILLSSIMAWVFVSNSIDAMGSHNQTLGWAIFALVLTMIGFATNERRQRWCGLGILVAAIIRVGVYDFWGFSDLYKVLTFFALTVICLGLSFLYYKFSDRLKEWL